MAWPSSEEWERIRVEQEEQTARFLSRLEQRRKYLVTLPATASTPGIISPGTALEWVSFKSFRASV